MESQNVKKFEVLISKLQDTKNEERVEVIKALGDLGDVRALEYLIAELSNNEDSSVRFWAARVLIKFKSPKIVEALIKGLKDEDFSVRAIAARNLGEIRNKQAVSALIDGLGDSDANVRSNIIDALGLIKDESVITSLLQILENPNETIDVRSRAALALGNLNASQAFPVLLTIFKNLAENYKVRTSAAEALINFNNDIIKETFTLLKNDKYGSVRSIIASGLGKLKSENSIDDLLPMLKDEDYRVRFNAVEALSQFKDPEILSELLLLLQTEKNTNVKNLVSKVISSY